MNDKKLLNFIQDLILLGVFLFSIFIHTEFSAIFFGVSLRHIFILITIPFFLKSICYKKNILFGVLVFLQFFLLLALDIFIPDHKVSRVTMYSYLLYCVPFFFDSSFYSRWTKRGVKLGFLGALFLIFLWANFGAFRFWNENCIAYLYFGGVNLYLFIAFLSNKNDQDSHMKKIMYFCLYVYGIYLLFQTNSRNIVLAELFLIIPFLLRKFFNKRILYYAISWFALIYAAFNVWLNTLIQNNSNWFNIILQISSEYFGKDTVFDGRLILQEKALQLILEHPIVGHGYGIYFRGIAPHNNFLVMIFTVGIIGVFIYYFFVFKILKMAYQNFCAGDDISFVCALMIMGFLIQLGAESFLIGNNIIVLMPYFYMGVIINRNRRLKAWKY